MAFWENRWQTQQIGWHRNSYNDLLTKHWHSINAVEGSQVLVPLCGKSLDMIWLANQGYTVVGLEIVEQAILEFFEENELNTESVEIGKHIHHSSHPYTIIQGDVFGLKDGVLQADAWYDRAAMIAIKPSSREAYVDQIRKQTKENAAGLLITFAYPQEEMVGPPFALNDEDVIRLFSHGFELECLETIDLGDEKDRGLTRVTSSVFIIKRLADNA